MTAGKFTKKSGFTLVELLVTVVVSIILATIAIPNFHVLVSDNRFSVTANDVLSSLVMARNEAIKKKANATISLGASGGWPLEVIVDGGVVASREAVVDNVTLSWSSLPGVVFSPIGRVAGEVSLCFFLDGAREKEIRILPSGQIISNDRGVFSNCI